MNRGKPRNNWQPIRGLGEGEITGDWSFINGWLREQQQHQHKQKSEENKVSSGGWTERKNGRITLILDMLHINHRWNMTLEIEATDVSSHWRSLVLKGIPENNNWRLFRAKTLWHPDPAGLTPSHLINLLYLDITQITSLQSLLWPCFLTSTSVLFSYSTCCPPFLWSLILTSLPALGPA